MLRTKAVRSTAAAAAFLVAAGCAADAVAPPAPRSPSAVRSEEPGAEVVPNHIKYRDSGAHPVAGRVGAASLTARALVGKSGVATMELTTGGLDAPSVAAAPGTIAKVQVKVYDSGGGVRFVDTRGGGTGGYAAYSYAGLERGTRFQVQAHVRGPGGGRTEVITVSDVVELRPDLAVGGIAAPRSAHVETPVNIAATVREVNGDVGARADCVLYVDGAEADRASGIWVDAGGIVTCAFAPTFSAAGIKRLEVRAEGETPDDFEPDNNSATATLEITSDPFHYSAFARDIDMLYETFSSTRTTRLADGFVSESQTSNRKTGREQASGIIADMPTRLTFPISRIELAQSSGATMLHQAAYDNVMPNARRTCFQQSYAILGYGKLFLCANAASTVVQYLRWAGDVTYESTAYSAAWDRTGAPAGTPVYSWNGRTEQDGVMPPLGDVLTIRVSISDDDVLYNTVVDIPLQPYEYKVDWPLSCKDATDTQKTLAFHVCTKVLWLDTGRAGSASGVSR